MSDTAIICLSIAIILIGLVWLVSIGQRRADRLALAPAPPLGSGPPACTPLDRVRQFFRRFSWYYLLAAGLVSYPYQLWLLVKWDVAYLPAADRQHQISLDYAKIVDPVLFYSKVSISVGVFCLINLLAWASLRVIPVLVDWATGYYRQEQRADFPQRPGFKGTFLKQLTDWQRMAVYLAVWGLEMLAAWGSVEAGFRIQ